MPVQVTEFTLRLANGARFHFHHGPTLYATLLDRFGNPQHFPDLTALHACESGRVLYPPDADYRFGLVCHPQATPSIGEWRQALSLPPQTSSGKTDGAPLGRGVTVRQVRDLVSGRILTAKDTPATLPLSALAIAASRLTAQQQITLRFDSPVLIYREPKEVKALYFDEHYADPVVILWRVSRAVHEWFPELSPGKNPPPVELLDNGLFRTEAPYPKKRLRGSRGTVTLRFPDGLPYDWAQTLLLAGLIGIGKSPNMGQGRYTVLGHPLLPEWPPRPAQTLLERASSRQHFLAAAKAFRFAGQAPGVDDLAPREFEDWLHANESQLLRDLQAGRVQAEPLRGVVIRQSPGKVRALTIPTAKDRFLQRLLLEEIAPAVEELLEDTSFAYRRRLSRLTAEQALRRAYDEGYRWVAESDITAFFDCIDWQKLRLRLTALWGDDPAIDLLMAWVSAPVEFGDTTVARSSGLPQGAVISPVLANLYLDAFDEAMSSADRRLVRYGDDFVVLCRSQDDATQALEDARQELERLGLSLHEGKTAVTSFEHGFRFLGYVFCRSVSLDASKRGESGTVLDGSDTAAALEAAGSAAEASWLHEWRSSLRHAVTLANGEEPTTVGRWHRPKPHDTAQKRPVYVLSPGLALSAGKDGLRIYRGEVLEGRVPWQDIREIVVLGSRRLSSQVITRALAERIPISLYSRAGKALGTILPAGVRFPSPLSIAQWEWSRSDANHLAVARSLVEAKIHNQRLLVRRQQGEVRQLREYLKERAAAALRCESIERLRGIEGQAASAYWEQWPDWVSGLPFPGRTGRGARDPVNVMLNVVYTCLFRECVLALVGVGLDPFCGLLHEGRGRYEALAADMQEPFRFLCDRLVLDLLHRNRIDEHDFFYAEKLPQPFRMKDDALRLLIQEWEKRFALEVAFDQRIASYRRHLHGQVERLRDMVLGERADLNPFRMKW